MRVAPNPCGSQTERAPAPALAARVMEGPASASARPRLTSGSGQPLIGVRERVGQDEHVVHAHRQHQEGYHLRGHRVNVDEPSSSSS